MRIGIPASADVDATVERCRQLGVNTVFVSCASLPGYRERGYPDAKALRALKEGLEQRGISVQKSENALNGFIAAGGGDRYAGNAW